MENEKEKQIISTMKKEAERDMLRVKQLAKDKDVTRELEELRKKDQ
jgi:hypothetical protein